mgnify:CR=1 FL=1
MNINQQRRLVDIQRKANQAADATFDVRSASRGDRSPESILTNAKIARRISQERTDPADIAELEAVTVIMAETSTSRLAEEVASDGGHQPICPHDEGTDCDCDAKLIQLQVGLLRSNGFDDLADLLASDQDGYFRKLEDALALLDSSNRQQPS